MSRPQLAVPPAGSRNLSSEDKAIQVAEVVHHKGQLAIPEGMSVHQAIELLERRASYLEEEVQVSRTFNVFPWDGANALNIALKDKFGWAARTGSRRARPATGRAVPRIGRWSAGAHRTPGR